MTATASKLRDYIDVRDYGANGNDTGNDTAAFNRAVADSMSLRRPLGIPHGIYPIDDLDYFPSFINADGIGQSLIMEGNGRLNSVLRCIGTGHVMTLGDPADGGDGAFMGLEMRDLGMTTKTAERAISIVWRFPFSMIENCHFEGFDVAIGPTSDDARSWSWVIDKTTFNHNRVGLQYVDHALNVRDSFFSFGDIGVEFIRGLSSASITGGGIQFMSDTLLKFSQSNVAAFALRDIYLENGSNRVFGNWGIDRTITRTITPGNAITVVESNVNGLHIDNVSAAMQAAPNFMEFRQDGHIVRFCDVSNSMIRCDVGLGNYAFEFNGPDDSNTNDITVSNSFFPGGTWAEVCRPEDRTHFGRLPTDPPDSPNITHKDRVHSATSGQLNSATSPVNYGPKFKGYQVWNDSQDRPVFATGSAPTDSWVYGDGSTAHTPA